MLLTAAAVAAPQSGSTKTIEPSDIVELREVSDPQLSPDGKLIVYSVLRRLSGAQHDDTSLWLVPSDASKEERPLVFGEGSPGNARWAADGRRIAFLSDRANPLSTPGSVPFRFEREGRAESTKASARASCGCCHSTAAKLSR